MKIGDVITMAGIEWKAFKKDKNGIYVFATSSIDDSRFSVQTNNYRYSLIRSSLLNGELLYNLKREMGDKLVPITLTLESYYEDGAYDTIYGDELSLLNLKLYKEGKEYIDPNDEWFWLANPLRTADSLYSLYVDPGGYVNYYRRDYVVGVRPFCILNL